MNIITKYDGTLLKQLASRIYKIVEKSCLCIESYRKILNDIVNTFIDRRLDDLLIGEIAYNEIDVSVLL